MYSKLKFTNAVQDVDKVLKKFANNLENKLNEAFELRTIRAQNKIVKYSPLNELVQSAITNCDYENENDIRLEIYTTDSNNTEAILTPIQGI